MTAPGGCRCLNVLLKSVTYRIPSTIKYRCISGTNVLQAQERSETEQEIIIPKRIKRSDTAILDELAKTVQQESGPHYQYHDDPYLLPYGFLRATGHALAKASGRRAAKHVMETYPKLFRFNPMDPMAEFPPGFALKKWAEEEDTVDKLVEMIHERKPDQAYAIYKSLKEKEKPIPGDISEQLLALLCVHNGQDPPETNETIQFMERSAGANLEILKWMRNECTWRDDGEAETVFNDLEQPSAESYNCLVRGRAMFGQAKTARELLLKMRKERIPVSLETYNAVIRIPPKDTHGTLQMIKETLENMKEDGIVPDVHTFNNALGQLVSSCAGNQLLGADHMKNTVAMMLNEMMSLGIEPSLTTWLFVLKVHYAKRFSKRNILNEVLTRLEGKNLALSCELDYMFFSYAMELCYNLQDIELAYKLNDLLQSGTNIKLLGWRNCESRYQSDFIKLLCLFEQIDTIMEYYDRTQFLIFPAGFNAMFELLKAIELNDGHRYLPQLWSDFIQGEIALKRDILGPFLDVMSTKQDDELQGQYLKIADRIKEAIEREIDERGTLQSFVFTGPMFGHLVQIYLHCNQFDTAWECFRIFKTNRSKIEGHPTEESYRQLIEKCIEDKKSSNVVECFTAMVDTAYPSFESLQAKAVFHLDLTEDEKQQIEDLD